MSSYDALEVYTFSRSKVKVTKTHKLEVARITITIKETEKEKHQTLDSRSFCSLQNCILI